MSQFCNISNNVLSSIVIRCCRHRNFDILAAVFTEVLDYMHDDLGLIPHASIQSSEADGTSPE